MKSRDYGKRFVLLRGVYLVSPVAGILCGIPFLFIFSWEFWLRCTVGIVIAVLIVVVAVLFVHFSSPRCPYCERRLSIANLRGLYSYCPFCHKKIAEGAINKE